MTLAHPAPAQAGNDAAEADSSAAVQHRAEVVRLLIAVMMLGQAFWLYDEAKTVYAAACHTLPNGGQLRVSLAFASAMLGDAEPAKALLGEVNDAAPDAEMTKVSLSLALKVAGDPDWRRVSQNALATSLDSSVRTLAQAVLDEGA